LATATNNESSRTPRRRHWWRWTLTGVVGLVVVIVAAVGLYITFQPVPAPLALPTLATSTPVGPLNGAWRVGTGSVAGFRLQQTVLGFSNDIVGRTKSVSGAVTVVGNQVTSAKFSIELATIEVGGKTEPQLAKSLDTASHPNATFTLSQPLTLTSAFTSGGVLTTTATGHLVMNGLSRAVSLKISGRRDGSTMLFTGLIPVEFSRWSIKSPAGFGFFGSLANHGDAEFLLDLHRS
jgi:polyisoprenoid-binding protein YceI